MRRQKGRTWLASGNPGVTWCITQGGARLPNVLSTCSWWRGRDSRVGCPVLVSSPAKVGYKSLQHAGLAVIAFDTRKRENDNTSVPRGPPHPTRLITSWDRLWQESLKLFVVDQISLSLEIREALLGNVSHHCLIKERLFICSTVYLFVCFALVGQVNCKQ